MMMTFCPGCCEVKPDVVGLLTTTVRGPMPPIPGIAPSRKYKIKAKLEKKISN